MARVGLIIVTFNCRRYLPALFAALRSTVGQAATLCLVDNGSQDDTVSLCHAALADGKLCGLVIPQPSNLGFAAACNAGVEALRAQGGYGTFVFLNPDTVPRPGWLQALVHELEQPQVGSAVSLLLLPDGTLNSRGNAVHFLGYGFVTGYGEPAATAQDGDLFFGSSASLAVSARTLEVMRELTGCDEIFYNELFLYGEDTDLGWRLLMAGLRNRLVTQSVVEHHSSFVGDRPRSRGMFYLERSRWIMLLANFRCGTLVLMSPLLLALELLQCLGWRRLYDGSRLELWKDVVRAVRGPEFWRRRTKIQRGRIVSDREILRRMESSIRHGAMKRRASDVWIDRLLAAIHRALVFCVRW